MIDALDTVGNAPLRLQSYAAVRSAVNVKVRWHKSDPAGKSAPSVNLAGIKVELGLVTNQSNRFREE